jgi:hypothetical protein
MAPQVKKAKTAFMFYQADQLAKIRAELGGPAGCSMGEAMTEVRRNKKKRCNKMCMTMSAMQGSGENTIQLVLVFFLFRITTDGIFGISLSLSLLRF